MAELIHFAGLKYQRQFRKGQYL